MKALSRTTGRLLHRSSSHEEENSKTNAEREIQKQGDVWYRFYLNLLFVRRDESTPFLSYKEHFRRRTVQPIGIPPTQLLGTVHQAFCSKYEHYSPLWGMMVRLYDE
jgi:hypothetical protein